MNKNQTRNHDVTGDIVGSASTGHIIFCEFDFSYCPILYIIFFSSNITQCILHIQKNSKYFTMNILIYLLPSFKLSKIFSIVKQINKPGMKLAYY